FENKRIVFCVDETEKFDDNELNIFCGYHSKYYTFDKSKYKNQDEYIEKHIKPTLENKEQFKNIIQPVLDWIFEIIVRENKTNYDFLIMWIAKLLQFANVRDDKIILVYGREGTGKNVFGNFLQELVKPYYSWLCEHYKKNIDYFHYYFTKMVAVDKEKIRKPIETKEK